MAKLVWDEVGKKLYETGVSNCALYPASNGTYPKGVAWSGISSITESPSGAEASPIYADNVKYLNLISAEDYSATIEAYMYPDEFAACDGSADIAEGVSVGQQPRKPFGLAYKTILGNDTELNDHGYKLHLVYGCLAAPSERAHSTVNDSPEAATMSWSVSTTPVAVPDAKPSATITIDSTKVESSKLLKLEEVLFGKEGDETTPRLPLPAEVLSILEG